MTWAPIVTVLATLVAAPLAADQDEARAQVQPRYTRLSAAVGAGDLAGLVAIYASDASFEVHMPDGYDRVRGAESIGGLWQGVIRQGAATFDATIAEATRKGDAIAERGSFVMKRKDATVFAKGTYSGEWRREGAAWRIVQHVITVEK